MAKVRMIVTGGSIPGKKDIRERIKRVVSLTPGLRW
jgi:hypothetical protein